MGTTSQTSVSVRWILDLSMLAFVCFMAGVLWFKVEALADDAEQMERAQLPERVVRIEEQVKSIKKTTEANQQTLKENAAVLQKILIKVGDE